MTDCSEANALLVILMLKVVHCKDRLTPGNISRALYGIHWMEGMLTGKEYRSVLEFFYENINRITFGKDGITPQLDALILENLLALHESITFSLPQLEKALRLNHYKSWEKINRLLADEVTSRRRGGCDYFTPKGKHSEPEKKINGVAVRICEGSEVMVKSNEYLFDLFKCDLIFKMPVADMLDPTQTSALTLNIETDGMTHTQNKNRIFCRRRDQFLMSKGVVVVRIDSASVTSMSSLELEEWMRSEFSKAKSQHTLNLLGLSDALKMWT
jgi:hypothetical protein